MNLLKKIFFYFFLQSSFFSYKEVMRKYSKQYKINNTTLKKIIIKHRHWNKTGETAILI